MNKQINRLAATIATIAVVGTGVTTAQAASKPVLSATSQMALHFKHEDAVYAARPAVNIRNSSPALYDEAMGGSSQVAAALGIIPTPVHDEGTGGVSQLDTALSISAAPVHDEAMGGVAQVDRALGVTNTPGTRAIVQSGGFNWGAAGIGVGAVLGALLLAAVCAALVRGRRRLVQS